VRSHQVFGRSGVVLCCKIPSKVEDCTKEELLEELHDEEPEESGDGPTPALLDATKIEEVIDSLTERLPSLT
jgi:hypothetical protein